MARVDYLNRLTDAEKKCREGTAPLDTFTFDMASPPTLTVPFDNTNGFSTGFVIVSPSSCSVTLTATVRDQNGAVLTTSPLSMLPLSHSSLFVADQFSGRAGQRGTIQLATGLFVNISGLRLRFNPTGSFTWIPTCGRRIPENQRRWEFHRGRDSVAATGTKKSVTAYAAPLDLAVVLPKARVHPMSIEIMSVLQIGCCPE
jgi:hypothetical protein